MPRAKRVIFLFMNGGPSQMDMFDPKPALRNLDGKPGRNKNRNLKGSQWDFAQHGESGMWFSELVPQLSKHADRLCVIRSMQTASRAHPLAIPLLHTGSFQFTRPSLGSWVVYGLGSEAGDLPGFVTINPTRTFGGPSNYGSAFLPTAYQATRIGWEGKSLKGVTLRNISRPDVPEALQTEQLAMTQALNREIIARSRSSQHLEGVVDALGLSARMQASLPRVMDLSQESKSTLDAYGIDGDVTDRFARQCLLARRLIEAGTRFVELTHGGWDHHSHMTKNLPKKCQQVDQPISALLSDLAQRGLLDETLLVWAGEFGRQPEVQFLEGKPADGRDHNAKGYTVWLAGGGVRAGLTYGATDELGYEAVENHVPLVDLHATILHLLGLDHTSLTFRYGGRDFRLTDVAGRVVEDIVA